VNGCTKTGSSSAVEKFDRYIFFSQGVDTKVSLIEKKEDLSGHTFGVVGFKYDNTSSWDAVKTSATPNVFRDATGNLVETEMLTCSADGTATYAPIQGWSNTKKFSFFAYYPFENQNVTLVNLDGTPYTGGTPAIKYTMNPNSFQSSMVDVMTAPGQTDKYWISSSDNNTNNSDIRFQFAHCLACLGLNVKNSSSGEITIKSVTLVVDGIKYTSVTIPLDASVSETYAGSPVSYAGLYLMLKDTEKTVTETGKEISDKLIFIPQTEPISIVSLSITFQRKYGEVVKPEETFITQTPITTNLVKGKKHILYVNFMELNTYVMLKSGNWDDGPNVNHEFN
jgi:hypothetical protein